MEVGEPHRFPGINTKHRLTLLRGQQPLNSLRCGRDLIGHFLKGAELLHKADHQCCVFRGGSAQEKLRVLSLDNWHCYVSG